MTAFAAPYTLLRRDGEICLSLVDPPHLRAEPLAAAPDRCGGLLRAEAARLIGERDFAVAFQPVVRIEDRHPVSHEVLLRLRPSPGAPTRPTRVFVDAVQGWDLGAALDLAVLDVALAAWPRDAATPMSVNISARSFLDPVFFARLLARISGEGTTVAVEITGLDGCADLSGMTAMVPALRGAGVRVVLDDFAATEACLACMRAVRFDEVKFSGAVLGEAVASPRGRKLLRALVALADAASSRTVAKLVETVPQAQLVQDLGIVHGQGWLFGAPKLHAPRRGAGAGGMTRSTAPGFTSSLLRSMA